MTDYPNKKNYSQEIYQV